MSEMGFTQAPQRTDECAECHVVIPMTKSMYKHTLLCLNVPDRGIRNILREHEGQTNEHSLRIVANLQRAEARGE